MANENATIAEPATQSGAENFKPFVPAEKQIAELTLPSVVLGALLGIVFGASSLYLVLRVGMTVSASIPVAVLSITLFRAFSRAFKTRRATVLENNIVQTTGSAGESIAFGVGVTMPALMILGYDMDISRVMLVSCLGGLLGILMMVPLRRAFIVKQHGKLVYPEGTACAKVLEVGERGGSSAATVFVGFGLSFVYQFCMEALKAWQQYPARAIQGIKGAVVALEASPLLMGVGYIIGFRVSCVMAAGGLMAALLLTPAIAFFGADASNQSHMIIYPGTKPIAEMSPKEIRDAYILYIGAGAVAGGGIISVLQALPLILSSLFAGLRDLGSRNGGGGGGDGEVGNPTAGPRTDRDLPLWMVVLGALGLVAAIAATSLIPTNTTGRIAGGVMVLIFGFLFVTVSSRLTGEIGSSSNPISGMTVATLLLTCLIFVGLGWVGPEYRLAALSIAAVVCIASSNGGTTSQDLKTGYLLGATPRSQQIAILVGALSSALVIGLVLLVLNNGSTIYTSKSQYMPTVRADVAKLTETMAYQGTDYKVWRVVDPIPGATPGKYLVDRATGEPKWLVDPAINGRVSETDAGAKVTKYDAPKATLMALIIDGIMTDRLPRSLVFLGAVIAIVMQLAGVPALAFAVGVYLPLSSSMPIFVGGLVRAAVDRIKKASAEESDSSPAVLLSSGYIAGGSIAGILVALLAIIPGVSKRVDLGGTVFKGWNASAFPALAAFGVMTLFLLLVGLGAVLKVKAPHEVETGTTAREENL